MNRRELLKLIVAATGGAVIGGEFLLSGCNNPESNKTPLAFTEENIAFLDEVAETILPQTTTAGAKAAGLGRFMTVMVNDCYTKDDQEIFHKGLTTLDDACEKMHGHGFMKATPEQRKALLISVDKETKEYVKKNAVDTEKKEKAEKEAEKLIDFINSKGIAAFETIARFKRVQASTAKSNFIDLAYKTFPDKMKQMEKIAEDYKPAEAIK